MISTREIVDEKYGRGEVTISLQRELSQLPDRAAVFVHNVNDGVGLGQPQLPGPAPPSFPSVKKALS
ncbi:unnamed protein product [Toxocara canis]|uniref:Glycosyltransferase n=1 Tax=Toxocara canis TaxID=6265 RepID=A0A183ULB5_TOXCA|nr:unnamed protein product [Toxocara canis]